jgi:hypothetical protein
MVELLAKPDESRPAMEPASAHFLSTTLLAQVLIKEER